MQNVAIYLLSLSLLCGAAIGQAKKQKAPTPKRDPIVAVEQAQVRAYQSGDVRVDVVTNVSPTIQLGMAQSAFINVELPANDRIFAVHSGDNSLVTFDETFKNRKYHFVILRPGTGFNAPEKGHGNGVTVGIQMDSGMFLMLVIYPVKAVSENAHRCVVNYDPAMIIDSRARMNLQVGLVDGVPRVAPVKEKGKTTILESSPEDEAPAPVEERRVPVATVPDASVPVAIVPVATVPNTPAPVALVQNPTLPAQRPQAQPTPVAPLQQVAPAPQPRIKPTVVATSPSIKVAVNPTAKVPVPPPLKVPVASVPVVAQPVAQPSINSAWGVTTTDVPAKSKKRWPWSKDKLPVEGEEILAQQAILQAKPVQTAKNIVAGRTSFSAQGRGLLVNAWEGVGTPDVLLLYVEVRNISKQGLKLIGDQPDVFIETFGTKKARLNIENVAAKTVKGFPDKGWMNPGDVKVMEVRFTRPTLGIQQRLKVNVAQSLAADDPVVIDLTANDRK